MNRRAGRRLQEVQPRSRVDQDALFATAQQHHVDRAGAHIRRQAAFGQQVNHQLFVHGGRERGNRQVDGAVGKNGDLELAEGETMHVGFLGPRRPCEHQRPGTAPQPAEREASGHPRLPPCP